MDCAAFTAKIQGSILSVNICLNDVGHLTYDLFIVIGSDILRSRLFFGPIHDGAWQ